LPASAPDGGDVLVVVAHPDDEVLGCGGTISKLARDGAAVTVLLALRRSDPRGEERWDELLRAFEVSCCRLGARSAVAAPLLAERKVPTRLERLSDGLVPWIEAHDTVLTHFPGDVHQSHRAVGRAVEIATRPFRRRRDVLLFEVPTSTDQAFAAGFSPNSWVVLDERSRDDKLAAIALYPSEHDPGRRPSDVLRQLEHRGTSIGVDHAEAFVVARQFR
jgi:LmbE family N-acetylglucosaminyl deacetylase